MQIDKSTCLSYNHEINDFGYKGVPNSACLKVVRKIEEDLNIFIEIDIQATHTFDLNAQDALFHANFTLSIINLFMKLL